MIKRINKKATTLTWSMFVTIILGLVIIGLITGVVQTGYRLAVKNFFDEDTKKFTFPWEKDDFDPYELELTTQEMSVDSSMNALKFAIDNIAKKQSVISTTLPDEIKKKTSEYCHDGVQIPDSKGQKTDIVVKCDNEKQECYVCNFVLPQDLSAITPTSWLNSFGDPKYLAYYESFPEGEDAYWHYATLKTASYLGITIVAVGTINFVTSKMGVRLSKSQIKEGAEKGAETFAKEFGAKISKEFFEESTELTLKTMTEKYGKEGIDSLVRSAYFRNALDELPITTSNNLNVKVLADAYETILRETATEMSEKSMRSVEKEASKRFLNELDEVLEFEIYDSLKVTTKHGFEFGKEVVKRDVKEALDTAIQKKVSSNLLKNARKEFMIELSTINAFKNLLEEGGEHFSIKAVNEVLSQSDILVKSLKTLPESYQKTILDRANQRVLKLFTKERGVLKRSSIEFFDDKVDNLAYKIPDSKLDHVKSIWFSVYGTSKAGLEALPTKGWVNGPIFPLALSKKYWKTLGVSVNPKTQTKHLSHFVYGKRYTLLLAVALLAEYHDTVYDKYAPGGVNSIILGAPSAFADKKKEYILDANAKKYYIALYNKYRSEGKHLFRDDVLTTRFYLASPCKTDLIIKQESCNCMRQSESFHYNFGTGPIDVKKGTIFIDPKATKDQTKDAMEILNSNQHYATSLLNDKNFVEKYQETISIINDDMAVKICGDRGMIESFSSTFGDNEAENYKTGCISVEPVLSDIHRLDVTKENYCMPKFPKTNSIKEMVSYSTIAAEIIIGVFSLGVGTPVIVAMNVADVAFSGLVTELWQKWPRSEEIRYEKTIKQDYDNWQENSKEAEEKRKDYLLNRNQE
jgi:hypothetical protein